MRTTPAPASAPGSRLGWAALGFGLSALVSSWQPVAAPFGLAVGLVSAVLAVRALRAGGRPSPAVGALILALAAVAASGAVLARSAGPGRVGPGAALVAEPPAGQAGESLDAAAAGSRAARERARSELEALERAEPRAPSR